jgi:hypothetical protein
MRSPLDIIKKFTLRLKQDSDLLPGFLEGMRQCRATGRTAIITSVPKRKKALFYSAPCLCSSFVFIRKPGSYSQRDIKK